MVVTWINRINAELSYSWEDLNYVSIPQQTVLIRLPRIHLFKIKIGHRTKTIVSLTFHTPFCIPGYQGGALKLPQINSRAFLLETANQVAKAVFDRISPGLDEGMVQIIAVNLWKCYSTQRSLAVRLRGSFRSHSRQFRLHNLSL